MEKSLSKDRIDEMNKYGRDNLYHKIQSYLKGERIRTFNLVNHGLAMVDDVLDSSDTPLEYLDHFQRILEQSFLGVRVKISTSEEQAIVDLGHSLNQMASAGLTDRVIGKHTYREVINYLGAESKNIRRRWNVLDKETLDEITLNIGSLVASQFLFILDPPKNPYEFVALTKSYGLAVKLADNLSDFKDDVTKGFINIPQEEIHHLRGICLNGRKVIRINDDELALNKEYVEKEYERIQQLFSSADRLLLKARLNRPIWNRGLDERLCLFKQICHTWLNQVEYKISESFFTPNFHRLTLF